MSALALDLAGLEPHPVAPRTVLNIGSGPANPLKLHAAFRGPGWCEVRFDIEPDVRPDIVGDMVDMRGQIADASFDAVWSSHNLEHLGFHQVLPALAEFTRVLKPEGFALVTCPDVEAVARLVVEMGLDAVAYESLAGPITMRDMLWGHGPSIAAGHGFMAHRTGFTMQSLAKLVLDGGFAEIRVGKDHLALWGLCLMPRAEIGTIEAFFEKTDQHTLFGPCEEGPAAP